MSRKISVEDFSKHLFWDVNLKTFDLEKHKKFMVERVLEYGLLSDWNLTKELYGKEEIKNISLNIRSMRAISLSFLSTIFKIDKTEFRCYKHRQLVRNVWNS